MSDYQKYTGHPALGLGAAVQNQNSAVAAQRAPAPPALDEIAAHIREALLVTSSIRGWLDQTTEAEPTGGGQTAPPQARIPSLMADAAFLREELEMIVRRLSRL